MFSYRDMNFTIIFEIIITYVLSKVSAVVDENGKHSAEEQYCKCEFQNPLLVLGKSFDQIYMLKMCEMRVISHANVKKRVMFTWTGSSICTNICKKCVTNIKQQNEPRNLKVALLESYCDIVDKEITDITNLANQCVCVYRIQCYAWQTVILYKIQANDEGLVKIQSN